MAIKTEGKPAAIAIDGPSGSGKSTAAKKLAERLGFIYVDTGAMYRSAALYLINKGCDLSDESSVTRMLGDIVIELEFKDGTQRISLNGRDVTDDIRTQLVAEGSSRIAVYSGVRKKLVAMQQDIAALNNVVMDGRDIGTHVLPGAQLKIYMDASAKVRAGRRVSELIGKGIPADYDQVLAEIIRRDERDATREHSPLVIAPGAVYIDTGDMTEDEVLDKIAGLCEL